MRAVKSRARKQNIGLTVPVATREARKIVDALMPGVGATVESRRSYDLTAGTDTIVTHITFPALHHNRMGVKLGVEQMLSGVRSVTLVSSSITITRSVA